MKAIKQFYLAIALASCSCGLVTTSVILGTLLMMGFAFIPFSILCFIIVTSYLSSKHQDILISSNQDAVKSALRDLQNFESY